MTTATNELASRIRLAVAVLLILVTGFWGFVITFSDSPANWSMLTLAGYIAAWHVPSAFVIGRLVPRKWWLGLAAAWGALLMLALTLPLVAVFLILAMTGAAYAGGLTADMVTNKGARI